MSGTGYDVVFQDPRAKQAYMATAQGMGYEVFDEGDHVHLELPRSAQGGPSLGRGRTKEAEAAAVEGAKIDAQLSRAPQQAQADASREAAVVTARTGATSAAEKASAAPAAIASMQNSLDSIDTLLKSKDLGSIVGLGSINPLNQIPGSDAKGLIARADQIAGQAFLAAFNQLKGGGAITEREGAAATAAMARLDRSQGLEDYKLALTDLRDAITPGLERQMAALNGGNQRPGAGSPDDIDALIQEALRP